MDDLDAILNNSTVDTFVHVKVLEKISGKKKNTGSGSCADPTITTNRSLSSKGKSSDKLPKSTPESAPKESQKWGLEVGKGSTTPATFQKQKQDEKKKEKKDNITLEDFKACTRVAKFGAATFKKLEDTIADKSSARL